MIYLLLGTLALGLLTGYALRILHEHNNYLLSLDKFLMEKTEKERDNSSLVEFIFAVLAAFVFYLCAMFLIFPEVLQ